MDPNTQKLAARGTKKQRIRKTISGCAERPRLSIYRSEKHIYGQLIDDEGGRTLASASTLSATLREKVKDIGPIEAAKLVGEVLAEKAQAAGVSKAVLDRNGRQYGGRIAALADGARSKGLQF